MRRNFSEFFRGGWSQLEGGPLLGGRHLDLITSNLQALAEGWLVANGYANGPIVRHAAMRRRVAASWARHGLTYQARALLVQNLVMNLPPGTLKSRLLMVFLPAWIWLHAPGAKYLSISGTPDNVTRDSHAHRDLVKSTWYRETFGIKWTIRPDLDGVNKWATTAGGERYSRGSSSGVTGLHVDFIFYDDPDNATKVFGDAERAGTQSEWTRQQQNRTNSNDLSVRVINQQRVHPDDMSAYLLGIKKWSPETATSRMGWAHFCLPLEFRRTPKWAPTSTPWGFADWRTIEGENLFPVQFSDAYIADAKVQFGSAGFEAQYNQNPDAGVLGWAKISWIRWFRVENQDPHTRPRPDGASREEAFILPRIRLRQERLDVDEMVISVDATFGGKKETNSAVGFGVFGRKGQRLLWLEDHTRQMNYPETRKAIMEVVSRWGNRGMPLRLFIEKKANGAALIDELTLECANGTMLGADGKPCVMVVTPMETGTADKKARFQVAVPWLEAGLLYVLDGAPWADEALSEVCGFPFAKRDDRADMLSQAVAGCSLKSSSGYDIKAMTAR